MNPFETLPDELLPLHALELDRHEIYHLCNVDQRFNRLICNNEAFWKDKFKQDYLFTPLEYKGLWKDLYRNYGAVYIIFEGEPFRFEIHALQVSCGRSYTMIIDMYNNVWGQGSNSMGQLGVGDKSYKLNLTPLGIKAKRVACGFSHTLLIDMEDRLHTFGTNFHGQLGIDDNISRAKPVNIGIRVKDVAAGSTFSVIIDMKGEVLTCGSNIRLQLGRSVGLEYYDPIFRPIGLKGKMVSCSTDHTLLIDEDDNLYTWGENIVSHIKVGVKAKRVVASDSKRAFIDLDDKLCWLTDEGVTVTNKQVLDVAERIDRLSYINLKGELYIDDKPVPGLLFHSLSSEEDRVVAISTMTL